MKKIFLVQLESGAFVFSRMPGNFEGIRKSRKVGKKAPEEGPDNGNRDPDADNSENYTELLPPAA